MQIKAVPDKVRAVLRRRAAANGRSLQECLLCRLVEEASTATVDEVLRRADGRSEGQFSFQ
ncbi:MAG: FitA-like ribbon-helix-helix domain-containing protein [Candidatus Dormibacteria bacterium]